MGLYAQETASVYTYKFGSADISLLQEVSKNDKPDILVNAPAEVISKYAKDGTIPGAVNAFVVQMNGKNIVIDSGFGTKLFENLRSLGIEARNVDVVLLTHLHGDHIGGMTKDGKNSFPNAKVYISQREHDYWAKGTNEKTRDFLNMYKNQIVLFEPGEVNNSVVEVIPGVKAFVSYGHTPGHTMYQFEDGGAKILVIGDVINVAAIQFPHPEIAAVYDVDKQEASKTKVKVLEYAAENNIPVAGMHIPFPGMGYTSKNGMDGFGFKPFQ